MKKVYIFLANGFEEVEALTVVDLLRRAGIEAPTVSIQDGKMVEGTHGIKVEADFLLSEVRGTMADAIVLPGGIPGTPNLKANETLMEMVLGLHAAGSYICAICAAPTILAGLGLVDGKKATSYPSCEPDMCGADYQKESVVVDGQIVTSRGVGTAIDFGLKIIELLASEKEAKEIAESIVYRAEGK